MQSRWAGKPRPYEQRNGGSFLFIERSRMKTMRLKFIWCLSLLVGSILASYAQANVSIRNGNFFVGYTDVLHSGGMELRVERVYNSKAGFKGIFGSGWGSDFDTHLTISADGAVILHEYGGGAENRFESPALDVAELERAVEALLLAARSTNVVTDEDAAQLYRRRLREDAGFRNDEWEKFRRQGLMAARELAAGAKLNSVEFGGQFLTRVEGGYRRVKNSGMIEFFDEAGHLRRRSDTGGNFFEFEYDAAGRLSRAADEQGNRIWFDFNTKGLLTAARDDKGRRAVYRYSDNDRLVYSRDTDGNAYEHRYDDRGKMTQILYADGTSMEMSYSGQPYEDIRSVKERDGTRFSYGYRLVNENRDHLSVAVTKQLPGQARRSMTYEYFEGRKASGALWTERAICTASKRREERRYSADGTHTIILRAEGQTRYDFDAQNRVRRREAPSEILEVDYAPDTTQILEARFQDKVHSDRTRRHRFTYDGEGNLISAKTSDGLEIEFVQGEKGLLKEVVMQNAHARFTRDAQNRITGIEWKPENGAAVVLPVQPGKKAKDDFQRRAAEAFFARANAVIHVAGWEVDFEGLFTRYQFDPDVCHEHGAYHCETAFLKGNPL